MCKGADSIVLPRCKFETPEEKAMLGKINEDLNAFAMDGLRTLVFGWKKISDKEYELFEQKLQSLKTSTAENKDELLLKMYDSYE